MVRRKDQSDDLASLDFKAMMKTPLGKWFFAPAIMAIVAIAGWGLILTLLQLQNGLPTWAYSAPGFPTVAIYYFIQLRKLWHHTIKPELKVQATNKGVGTQTVSGRSIVPNIQGDNNVIHQTFIQQGSPHYAGSIAAATSPPAPPTHSAVPSAVPALDPEPKVTTAVPLVDVREREPTTTNDSDTEPEILHAKSLKVQPGSHEVIPLDLDKGDVLRGSILSDASVFAFVLSERGYGTYWKSREPGSARMLCDDDLAAKFRWTAPRGGRYYFVLDTYGKQTIRNVWVQLERSVSVPA